MGSLNSNKEYLVIKAVIQTHDMNKSEPLDVNVQIFSISLSAFLQ